jgi:hypothetical protein
MQYKPLRNLTSVFAFVPFLVLPALAEAATPIVANPLCPSETAFFAPDNAQNIIVPKGFTVSVFASKLNMPTGIAFLGNKNQFQVFVLESGHGLPSKCNEQGSWPGGEFDPANPFTPDILVFDQNGKKIAGPLAKPTATGGGLQPAGPAVDIAFERGFQGGRLFATDSNQATHGGGTKQQLAHRHCGHHDGAGHAIHYGAADRRPPDGAARVQRRLDLLVAGLDD